MKAVSNNFRVLLKAMKFKMNDLNRANSVKTLHLKWLLDFILMLFPSRSD